MVADVERLDETAPAAEETASALIFAGPKTIQSSMRSRQPQIMRAPPSSSLYKEMTIADEESQTVSARPALLLTGEQTSDLLPIGRLDVEREQMRLIVDDQR